MKVSIHSTQMTFGCIAILSSLFSASISLAGNEGSGGGAQLESSFRIRGYDLITQISASPAAEKLCSSTTLQTALESTQIRVVDQLTFPSPNEPTPGQQLDAWTVPGDIQLLKSSWSFFLNYPRSQLTQGKSVDALILHEIYRATAGACDDENFKISNRILRLLKGPSRYSKIYKFTSVLEDTVIFGPQYLCDRPIQVEGQQGICILIGNEHLDITNITLSLLPPHSNGSYQLRADRLKTEIDHEIPKDQLARVANFIRQASPDHPLYVVFDMQTGTIAYGLDLSSLFYL